MGLRLIIEDYEGATTVFPLGDGAVTIGREEGNTITLPERNISRTHARLAPADKGWTVEDLHSYNGVRVNGEVIDGASILHEGDLIQIGDYQLLVGDETSTRSTMDLEPKMVAAANDGNEIDDAGFGGGALPVAAARPSPMPAGMATAAAGAGLAGGAQNYDALYDELDEPKSGGAGKWAALLLVLGLGGGAGWYFLAGPGKAAPAVAQPEPVAAAVNADVEPPSTDEVVADEVVDEGALEDEVDEAGEVVDDDPAPTGSGSNSRPRDPAPADDAVDAGADDAGAEEADAPTGGSTAKKRPKKKTSGGGGSTLPPPPTADATELLAEARKAQLGGDYSKAYSLAQKSYQSQASADAAQVMGVAACKMGDANKAKGAYNKLSGNKKTALKSVCESAGISL